jgi:glycosyltransferase involved in cell wall biosynthesis
VGQSAFSLAAARLRGMRTVLDVVNTHVDDLAEQAARECAIFGTQSFLGDSMKRRIYAEYRRADLIRVMSHHAKRTFEERGVDGRRIVVATPPIDLGEFPQAKFESGKFRVCFVGLLQPWKGFHYLVEAFQRLALRDAELTLWGGAGARPITKYLEEKLAACPDVRVVPAEVRRVGYGEVYGSSSVLVHPSLTDGFGYVVAEAMASGIPVIVSRNAGAADLVVDGVNGYVVPPRDVDAIADRLRHLAERPALVREMGAAARESAASLTVDRFRGELVERMKHLI